MEPELICKWLELPSESWPPNHYVLLGLPVGETDIRKIEDRVHDRLARLRHYQLHHPDQVTHAMNRLAQAFSCLTDPQAKKVYDASLGASAPVSPSKSGVVKRPESVGRPSAPAPAAVPSASALPAPTVAGPSVAMSPPVSADSA
ncbi:MAG: hypothetical protein HY343_07980, partial [Lentisphaerae bacterium]|nr:hypothetical protein [Lentisphaerota bacterium]